MSSEFFDMVVNQKIPVKLFNPSYKKYLFVSNDIKGGDNVLEAHSSQDETRNQFTLESVGNNQFRIYNPQYKKYLFVSNDKLGGDNVVEAHEPKDEPRNTFEFQLVGDNRYRIFNPAYKSFLFVSNDIINGDNTVEAHSSADEERNEFSVLLPEATKYILNDVQYEIPKVQLIKTQPDDVIGEIDLINNSDLPQTCSSTITLAYEQTENWSNEAGISVGVSTEVKCGIPILAEGKVKISATTTFSHSWGQSHTESKSFSQQISAQVAGQSKMTVNYALYLNKITVPYTAKLTICYAGGQYDAGQIKGEYQGVCAPYLSTTYGKNEPLDT